jgi:hypothetical protein
MNKNLLMSYEKYSKVRHETPYFYSLKSDNQLLYYFGTNHSQDPNNPQYNLLMEKWNKFASESNGMKTAVIIESFEISTQEDSIEKSIRRYGERGTGAYLASQNKSLLVFGEPGAKKVVAHLLKKYSKEEVLLFFESIAINFWYKNKSEKSLQEFLSSHTDKYRRLLNWPDLIISTDLIKDIYKKIFNQELDINDEKIFSRITSPVGTGSRINELSRSQSMYRNEYILNQIEKYWDEGYDIFIIYGAGHAVMQEPAIRSLID